MSLAVAAWQGASSAAPKPPRHRRRLHPRLPCSCGGAVPLTCRSTGHIHARNCMRRCARSTRGISSADPSVAAGACSRLSHAHTWSWRRRGLKRHSSARAWCCHSAARPSVRRAVPAMRVDSSACTRHQDGPRSRLPACMRRPRSSPRTRALPRAFARSVGNFGKLSSLSVVKLSGVWLLKWYPCHDSVRESHQLKV